MLGVLWTEAVPQKNYVGIEAEVIPECACLAPVMRSFCGSSISLEQPEMGTAIDNPQLHVKNGPAILPERSLPFMGYDSFYARQSARAGRKISIATTPAAIAKPSIGQVGRDELITKAQNEVR